MKITSKALHRFCASVSLIAATSLLFSACTKKDSDGNLNVLHRSHPDDIKTLDPANAYDTISLDIVPAIYETLYQYAYLSETYRVVPLLAADLPSYSPDRLTLTIPIKRGVKFQDDPAFKKTEGKGRELTAHDFVYSFKRLALPSLQSQGFWIFDGKIAGFNAFHDKLRNASKEELPQLFEETPEGIQAADPYTLKLKLLKPYPQLLNILCMGFTSAVPREAVETYGDERGNITEHPVGTGPFVLTKWNRGHRIVLDRNPTHHAEFYPTEGSEEAQKNGHLADAGKPLPLLDRISISVVREEQPAWLGFMKGDFDSMGIPKDNFRSAIVNQISLSPTLANKGIRLSIDTSVVFYYVSFNMKDKLIGGNKYLRQAISSSVNREKWIEIFTNGRGKKMVSALPPGIPDRPEDSKLKYDYNPTLAKELLKRAGYPEGKNLPVINFDMRGSDSLSRQMGEFFTQQFSEIGVKINIIYNTFPAYLQKAKDGNLQVSMGGWAMDYPDAENNYQLLYGQNKAPGPNESNFDNPTMNKLYEQIAVMESSPKRAALIKKIEELVQEECPWAYGYYHTNYRLSHPWLKNYQPNDILLNPYKYYRIDKEEKKRALKQK